MKTEASDDAALLQLQCRQRELLDDIDGLVAQGLGRYVDLPQIIVCGDQSSGKSSVLEAISQVKFPADSGVCTRFATELVLRREANPRMSVTIQPGCMRSEDERRKLRDFHATLDNLDDFTGLVNQAKAHMGISQAGSRQFTDDVLRVEICGPDKPHLTMVDLPGLIQTADNPTDIAVVRNLVESYMKSHRSIILAIVSAERDWQTQAIFELIKNHDHEGARTMGIITKPDRLEGETPAQAEYVRMARNQLTHLRLGWHVVVNRDYGRRGASASERDQRERDFLGSGVWRQVDRGSKGISKLRQRLSDALMTHICASLPSLIEELRHCIGECTERLRRLGDSRASPREQRSYLIGISNHFQQLVSEACEGPYRHTFFDQVDHGEVEADSWRAKRLRAIIHELNDSFADRMAQQGHSRRVMVDGPKFLFAISDVSKNGQSQTAAKQTDHLLLDSPWNGPGFESPFGTRPSIITRDELILELDTKAIEIRDTALPNFPNSQLVTHLFRDQSKHWEELASTHLTQITVAVRTLLRLLLQYLAVDDVYSTLLRHHIEPWLRQRQDSMAGMLNVFLESLSRDPPVTYDPTFLALMQSYRTVQGLDALKEALGATDRPSSGQSEEPAKFSWNLIETALKRTGSQTRSASSEIICATEAYYTVSPCVHHL
jgi:hypothetical protein